MVYEYLMMTYYPIKVTHYSFIHINHSSLLTYIICIDFDETEDNKCFNKLYSDV